MKLFLKLVSFFSILPLQKPADREDLAGIGRQCWWFLPLFEGIVISITALLCTALNKFLAAPFLAAAFFVFLDHGFHGLRRLDGFADLSEGLFYKAANPGAGVEETYRVVRTPQIGAFGAAAIFLYLLLQWNIWAELLRFGSRAFLLAAALTAVISKISVCTAMGSPRKFREKSRFDLMAAEIGKPSRIFFTVVVSLLLCSGLVLEVYPREKLFILLFFVVLLAVVCGLSVKMVILKLLKVLNGDIIGFSWCTSEIVISLFLLAAWKFLLGAG